MFTGLILGTGLIAGRSPALGGSVLTIRPSFAWDSPLSGGESVSVSGVCLTVARVLSAGAFEAYASQETLSRSTLSAAGVVNLERALRLGDRLGGHIVSGHVDQAAVLASRTPKGESLELFFSHPPELGRHIVSKGSVALDGVSLTVNEKRSGSFSVNVIPETLKRTTLSSLKTSDRVNLETDILGKHVESLLLFHLGSAESGDGGRKTGGLTLEKLVLEGF